MRLNSAPIRDLTIYTYGAEATAIARWPFDVAELLPGAVPVADRVPQMPLRINCRHVQFIFGVEAGASYVPDGPAIARWPFDVAELLPGANTVADRVPQTPVGSSARQVQYARPPRESELFSPGQVRQAVLTGWAPQEPGGHSDADVAVDGGAKGQRHEVLHGVPPVPGDIGLPRQGGNSVRP